MSASSLAGIIAEPERNLAYGIDTALFARRFLDFTPEPHQVPVLRSNADRGILCCSRQWGKSTVIGIKALHRALFKPGALIMLCAPTLRQSNELLVKIKSFTGSLPTRLRTDGHNRVSLVLPNRSRIVAIPANPDTTRGFSSVSMMLIDEAARVPDPVFHALTPMLARSNGNLWVMSTPRGRQGFFHDIWHNGDEKWFRVFNTIDHCTNIPRDFVERERREKPTADFLEDYHCVFQDSAEQLFATGDIDRAFTDGVKPLFEANARVVGTTRLHYYIGIDLGQRRDHTAVAVLEQHSFNTGDFDLATATWKSQTTLQLRHLEMMPLQTPYHDVIQRLSNLVSRDPLSGNATMVLDAGGPGYPVLDFIRKARLGPRIVPITITGGESPGTNTVPKRALVSNLQLALQNHTLAIARSLPLSQALRKELAQAKPETHTGDLAMALALAAWQATTTR